MNNRRTVLLVAALCMLGGEIEAQLPTPSPTTVVTAPVTVIAPEPNGNSEPVRVVQEGPIKVVQSGPITFKLPLSMLIGWLVTVATGLAAIAAIWRYGSKAAELLVKCRALLASFERNGTVLDAIAREFKSDSGSSLKDAINRIEEAARVAQETAEHVKKMLSDHLNAVEGRPKT